MTTTPTIETPRGEIIIHQTSMQAELVWYEGAFDKMNANFNTAQKFVDSEVLRLSGPYIPLRTGMLVMSGILGTEIGSGLVQWIAPYAKAQYYGHGKIGRETGPLRGPFWFERMKAVSGATIIAGARKLAGQDRK